jgi:hypothetical protein
MGKTQLSNLLSYRFLIPLSLLLGLVPFFPQPHLVEKLGMLFEGSLRKPIDIFDLFWHSWPTVLLFVKAISDRTLRS